MNLKVLIFLLTLLVNINFGREICDKVRITFSEPKNGGKRSENETTKSFFSMDISHEILYGYYPMWKIYAPKFPENFKNDFKISSIRIREFHLSDTASTYDRINVTDFPMIIGGLINIDMIWIKTLYFGNATIYKTKIYFNDGSFVAPNGNFFQLNQTAFTNITDLKYTTQYPTEYTCISFKNITEELIIPKRCKTFKSQSILYRNELNFTEEKVNATYEILEKSIKISTEHNVKNLSFYLNGDLLNCTSPTPTTSICIADFSVKDEEKPLFLQGYMNYNKDKFGNSLKDVFLVAEISIQQNQTIIKKGEAFNDNCIHLNNYSNAFLKFHHYQSWSYIRSSTFCCQEYYL